MNKRKGGGLTLVELLFSMALVSVLAAISATGFAQLSYETRLSMLGNQFLSDLAGARSEAIKRGKRVVLCKSADATSCVSSGGWGQGWLVFEDQNNNGTRDATERLVSQLGAQPAGWTLSGTFTGAHFVSYHPSGRTMLPSGALQAGTLTICRASPSPIVGVQVVISTAGRPRTQRTHLMQCG